MPGGKPNLLTGGTMAAAHLLRVRHQTTSPGSRATSCATRSVAVGPGRADPVLPLDHRGAGGAPRVIRDRRPDLAPGIWVPLLASRTDEGIAAYAAKPWAELVDLVREGPPVWSPARVPPIDDAVNLVEFFIHHEDVLRGDEQVGPRRTISLRESRRHCGDS